MSAIKTDFIVPFMRATYKVFESMAGMRVEQKEVYIKKGYGMFGEISAIIGFSGTISGTCAISLTGALAIKTVENMLGEKIENGIDDVVTHDGVGELVNMIAGHAKAALAQSPYLFNIALPTIISGINHEFYTKNGSLCVVVLFEADGRKQFTLDLCMPAK